ncbi:MAG: response regulator [Candidatus Omnitrophota bacterium]
MKKPIILVADDEKDARSAVVSFLRQRFDCDFNEVSDGEEAVEFVKRNPCDVILLDIKMPRKSGITVIKESKEIDPDIDIIIVSAWISENVSGEAMKIGASDYLIKPVNLTALSMKLSAILDKRGQLINKTWDSGQ